MEKKRLPGMLMQTEYDYNTLAYIGDGIFELRIRMFFLSRIHNDINRLHSKVVRVVNGKKQVEILFFLDEFFLTDSEKDFIRKVRNNRKAGKSPVARLATAFEALIGYYHISGEKNRLEEILCEIEKYLADEGCDEKK